AAADAGEAVRVGLGGGILPGPAGLQELPDLDPETLVIVAVAQVHRGLLAGVNRAIDYQRRPLNHKPVPAEKGLDGTKMPRVSAPMPSLLALLLMTLVAGPARADDPPPSCPFAAGALAGDTLPDGTPHGAEIPIDTIVVLMQENRSYDHYFGQLRKR